MISKPRWMILCGLVFASVFAFQPQPAFPSDPSIPIEGIVYESSNPRESYVIIGGRFYSVGSKYQDYEITEIQQNQIQVKDSSGVISKHGVSGGTPMRPQPVASPGKSIEPTVSSQTKPQAAGNPLEQFGKMLGQWNPMSLMGMAQDAVVMTDIRKLQTQAHMAMAAHDLSNLDQMIQQGLVDPSYAQGKNGYKYRIAPGPQGALLIYADPIEGTPKPDAKHFMVDQWGNMRVQKGSPATESSPVYQSPALPPGADHEAVAKAQQISDQVNRASAAREREIQQMMGGEG